MWSPCDTAYRWSCACFCFPPHRTSVVRRKMLSEREEGGGGEGRGCITVAQATSWDAAGSLSASFSAPSAAHTSVSLICITLGLMILSFSRNGSCSQVLWLLYPNPDISVWSESLMMIPNDSAPSSSGDDDGGERGLLHTWKGYSCSVTPDRLLLPRPVLQVALGVRHGVLLVEGTTIAKSGFIVFHSKLEIIPLWFRCCCYFPCRRTGVQFWGAAMEAESCPRRTHPGMCSQRAACGRRGSWQFPQRGSDGGRRRPHVGGQRCGTVWPVGPQCRPQPDSGGSGGLELQPPADGACAGAGLWGTAHPGAHGPAGGVGMGQRLPAGPHCCHLSCVEAPEGWTLSGEVCTSGGLRGFTQPGSGALPWTPGCPTAPRGQMQTL